MKCGKPTNHRAGERAFNERHDNMKYTLEFTPDELNLVGAALAKLPFESVSALIARLTADAAAQNDAAKPAAAHDAPVDVAA